MPELEFLKTEVYRIKDESQPGGMRYLAVEPQLQGEYRKYNGNNGYVLLSPASVSAVAAASSTSKQVLAPVGRGAKTTEDVRVYDIPQAFSHWTHMKTKGSEIVVDMQGTEFRYTDPQLHSKGGKYGRADLKAKGIKDFFRTHECGVACRALGLHRQPGPGGKKEGAP